MAVRPYAFQSVLVFLFGGGGPGGLPPASPLPSDPGNQPPDEKALGFPPVVGSCVEYDSGCDPFFSINVDENIQT